MKKQNIFFSFQFILFITLLLLLCNCETDQSRPNAQKPTLNSAMVSDITQTSAVSGGIIVSDGGAPITTRGVCWFTSENPTTSNFKTSDGIGTGTFTSYINNL